MLRTAVQIGFVALTVAGVFLVGGHAERWCPFGGVEAIHTYATEGNLPCSLGVSNLLVLAGVLLATLLLRRAFCGYTCPIGAISEWLGRAARRVGSGPRAVPRRLDAVLSWLKYPLLGVILWFTWRTAELVLRGYDPCYALISRHGEDITAWAYVVSGAVAAGSLVVPVPFCRWLCPLAAVLNPFSRVSPARVVRDRARCVDCGECGAACPMAIAVDEVPAVTHARCTGCLDCVEACPEREEGALSWRPFGRRGPRAGRPALVAALLLLHGGSVLASVLAPLPSFTWSRGELPARTASVDLVVDDLTCRGRANLLVWFLTRDDLAAVEGPLRLEAWPGPGSARAVVTFDPGRTDAAVVKAAIVEPCFDPTTRDWRTSPFRIEGYDPFAPE